MSDGSSERRRSKFRSEVWARDLGVCAECGRDAGKLKRVLERLHRRGGKGWQYRQIEGRLRQKLREEGFLEGKEFWEADHRIPLVLGGEDSLENLRTLCRPCHVAVTARLARHRERRRRLKLKNFPEDWVP